MLRGREWNIRDENKERKGELAPIIIGGIGNIMIGELVVDISGREEDQMGDWELGEVLYAYLDSRERMLCCRIHHRIPKTLVHSSNKGNAESSLSSLPILAFSLSKYVYMSIPPYSGIEQKLLYRYL